MDSVDLYFSWLEPSSKFDQSVNYLAMMSKDEREIHRRFYFELDRRRYALTRALVRTSLSLYAPIPPSGWSFHFNSYGRPKVGNAIHNQSLNFNVSHAENLVLLAVTSGRAIGVDIENTTKSAPIEVADMFFSPFEINALHELPANEQSYRFFEYWTLKEAYIKAKGRGLSIDLDSFSFEFFSNRRIRLNIEDHTENYSERWSFIQFNISSDFVGAVCIESGPDPIFIRAFKSIPLTYCIPFSLDITNRNSY